ncbi:glycosyl hydrolase [Metarhizium acridum CQMa 102]|uniref:Glycosyl hydrolase n=1 Tax=Metarhizium acridum (strain CQMa 102) TaxID=655827 RepID=E9DVH6_METAQ|nr:glycosyl hydrolase [Metarhizium acridum CQMa 102]EFY92353.1 glycosyl hydrolase [Metarhizium acridum CQMa 102]
MPNYTLRKSLVAATVLLAASRATGCDELDILAGQHVVYSFPSSSQPPDELVRLTRAGLVGGVILFGVNVDANTSQAMSALKHAYDSSPAPALLKKKTGKDARFLVTTDQEGGQPGDFTDYYGRSFGNTSQQVVRAAVPFISAQQGRGVSACAKHFPGLGAASHDANTDEEPVVLNLTLSEVRAVDQAPYKAAIAADVDMVMASWAVYPALDHRPAGLSAKWIKGELRVGLGFEGVTITDALEAGSLAAYGDAGARGTAAAAAGMDMLLASGKNVTQGEAVRTALVQALKKGELDRAEFDAATARIAALRSRIAA